MKQKPEPRLLTPAELADIRKLHGIGKATSIALFEHCDVLTKQRDDLLEAVEAILAITDRDHVVWERARAAIAQVRGTDARR